MTEIPVGVWIMHRHSENIFKVTNVHALHVETMDLDDGRRGFANRYMLEQDLAAHRYTLDPKGKDA